MPIVKKMSHDQKVAELIRTYNKTGKIGLTVPKDKKHALEIANAIAYNMEETYEPKMKLEEILEGLNNYISERNAELTILKDNAEKNKNIIRKENSTTKNEIFENPKVKITLDNGETFETEVDPKTSEDDLKKQYAIGSEINVGRVGQERKARIKSATLTKSVGEGLEPIEIDLCNDCIDVIAMDVPLFIRMLEWAREEAKNDIELHEVTENAVALMKNDTEFLAMADYENIIKQSELEETNVSDMGIDPISIIKRKKKIIKNEDFNNERIIGKEDLIRLIMSAKMKGLTYSAAIDELADLIFDDKIKITGTLRHGLHKLNKFKRENDRLGFQDYLQEVSRGWLGQIFSR